MFWNNSKHKTEQRRPLGGQRVGGFTFVAISEHIQIEVAVNELKMDNAFQTVFFLKKELPQMNVHTMVVMAKDEAFRGERALKTTMQTCLASETLQLS